jgi:hypothetical protein
MQPGLFAPSIIRAELSDKAFLIPKAGESTDYSEFSEGWIQETSAQVRDSLYDSCANPVNITAVAIYLLI